MGTLRTQMPTFISAYQAARLRNAAERFKRQVSVGTPWTERSDDELWRRVLSQIAVIGRAEPGNRLQHDSKIARLVSIKRLAEFNNDLKLQRYLHRVFAKIGVRYVGSNWRNDKKAAASAKNFRTLMQAGGPRKFFEGIARCKSEGERIETLQKSLKYYGNKGARDTLIELGLAQHCMALDVRIFGVLEKVGVRIYPNDIYRQVEKELIQKVAHPLGISGAVLDRILFQKYNQIVKELEVQRL